MRKNLKISITILVSAVLYAGFYFLMSYLRPEEYERIFNTFLVSILFSLVAIPVGMLIMWFLQKNNLDQQKINIIFAVIAVIWTYIFGWLTLTGLALGVVIAEKENEVSVVT